MRKAFTLVEILVVVTIISILASVAAVSYSSSLRQSRDARRKTDLEQIRAAVEMYKSYNNTYPASASLIPGSPLADPSPGTTVYLSKVPQDPKSPSYVYYYSSLTPFSDYEVCAFLEAGGTNAGVSCGASNCNYCLGPYGQK